jgi:hypothetical protein
MWTLEAKVDHVCDTIVNVNAGCQLYIPNTSVAARFPVHDHG